MKKLLILLCILSITSFCFAQKKKNKGKEEVTPINQSDLPVTSSETIEPLSAGDNPDVLQTPKWKDFWKFSGTVGLKISQTQLVNWAAGGNSNFAGITYANLTLNYKKNKIAWDTNLDTDFGVLYSSDFTEYQWRKANDKIKFHTTFGYEISPSTQVNNTWFVAVNGTFKSQYMSGYNYPGDGTKVKVSNWLSPSYTELSAGVNWKWKDKLSLYYSPVAGLITSCTDSILRPAFGVLPDKTNSASLGMTFRAGMMYDGVKNLKILSTLQLYTPYTDKDQKFGNFNVDWDVIITYQFLKVLSVSLTTNVKYYHKVLFPETPHQRVQFQEILGLGVAYSF
ncbi:MAG: DUF3078 domain-containing protein [Bacteroidetes bacterium]|nr:DUF3078 domain-containing protein [Bacteroidota bacterium]MCL1968061.1 DUF3078 domain-containing protein [Bacteroidota bacterium]